MQGEIFESNNCGKMEIVSCERGKCVVRFVNTGTEVVTTLTNVRKGAVKDKYAPTVGGVGYLGGADTTTYPLLYSRWKRMIQSCYDQYHLDFSSNGGKGIKVDTRWHSFENYQNDILELWTSCGEPDSYRIFRRGESFNLENILLVASNRI